MKNISKKKFNTLIDIYIISFIFILIALFKAFENLTEIFSYGFFKKEVLTDSSNLGFDLKIKIRSK